jgi:hypothetical protein
MNNSVHEDVQPYNNASSRHTRYKPELTNHIPVPQNFKIEFGVSQVCINTRYMQIFTLEQVSRTEELTQEDVTLLLAVWKEYKSRVQFIFDTVIDQGRCDDIEDKHVQVLCILVRIISQLLCKVYPYNTIGFYGVPLYISATENGSRRSEEWTTGSGRSLGDHWLITGNGNIWVAWRQEAGSYFIVYNHGKNIVTDKWHPSMERLEKLITSVFWLPQSPFADNTLKSKSNFIDLDIFVET